MLGPLRKELMSASPLQWRRGAAAPLKRYLPIAALGAAIVFALALAAFLYDHSRRGVIAAGVRIDGVGVGGLGERAALEKVDRALGATLDRPVTVRSGGRSWTLGAREARLALDARSMVAQAVGASREGSFITRAARDLFGGRVNRDIPLAASYSHEAVLASASGLREVGGQDGIRVESARLRSRIERALTTSPSSRTITVPYYKTHPTVGISQLAARYPAYIIIDRAAFRLRFYQHLKPSKTYEIAVGMEGLETPAGIHRIEWKQEDPPWYVPNKAWAGRLAGTVVPPGPLDPLKARFMSFDGGAGIHGIDPSEYETIGHNASHGCVRMRIPDVIDLYSRSPVGTPVFIA
jgi:lipoprotein-anchoring transpeptidase ErfK/SrfK